MLIILSGLPGVGKTTIARLLARELGAVHVRIDSIEHAIGRAAMIAEPMQDAGYRVGYAIARDNLALGRIVIADSVNPLPVTRTAWRDVAAATGTRSIDVEIICSNRDEHRRRVKRRVPDIPGFWLPTWQDVVDRDYRSRDDARIIVDTADCTADEGVRMIMSKIGAC